MRIRETGEPVETEDLWWDGRDLKWRHIHPESARFPVQTFDKIATREEEKP